MAVAELTIETIKLILISWFLAAIAGIPLGIVITRSPKFFRTLILRITGTIETVPFIAMLAIVFPLMGLLEEALDMNISTYVDMLLVLFLYGLLPMVVNTFRGITNLDPAIKEAAIGMGMRDREILLRVELPLALPMIITGLEIAVVYIVGIAPLAAFIGIESLGDMLLKGAQRIDFEQVAVGTALLVALGIGLSRLVRLSKKKVRW